MDQGRRSHGRQRRGLSRPGQGGRRLRPASVVRAILAELRLERGGAASPRSGRADAEVLLIAAADNPSSCRRTISAPSSGSHQSSGHITSASRVGTSSHGAVAIGSMHPPRPAARSRARPLRDGASSAVAGGAAQPARPRGWPGPSPSTPRTSPEAPSRSHPRAASPASAPRLRSSAWRGATSFARRSTDPTGR